MIVRLSGVDWLPVASRARTVRAMAARWWLRSTRVAREVRSTRSSMRLPAGARLLRFRS